MSASGGFALLLFYGSNLSVAVWVGFIALFGVADDCSVVRLSFLEDKFKDKQPQSIAECMVKEGQVKQSLGETPSPTPVVQ